MKKMVPDVVTTAGNDRITANCPASRSQLPAGTHFIIFFSNRKSKCRELTPGEPKTPRSVVQMFYTQGCNPRINFGPIKMNLFHKKGLASGETSLMAKIPVPSSGIATDFYNSTGDCT